MASGSSINVSPGTVETHQSRLVGLVVNGEEVDTLEVIFTGTVYYLPIEAIADHIGVTISPGDEALYFETPGGMAVIPANKLLYREHEVYVSGPTLREHLATESRFDQSSYAVIVDLPWWKSQTGPGHPLAGRPEPDRVPPRASLSQMRVDYNYSRFDDTDRHYLDYRFDGALLDGGWRMDVAQDLDEDTVLREFYWIQARDHSQVLIGRQDAILHPLFPSASFTGGQMLLSNQALDPVLGYTITRSDFARTLARPQQDIRGHANAGNVAELRVEGRIVARQRVRLNGEFEFLDVEFPSRGFSQVEVFIRDGLAGTLLEVQDHSRSASQLMLDAGHQVAMFGAGGAGNVADPNDPRDGGVGMAQWRAGISDTLTLEAAYQGADGVNTAQVGFVQGLGQNWVTALGLVADDNGHGAMMELFGYGKRWNLEYLGRETEDGYRGTDAASLHDVRYNFFASRTLTLGGRGRYSDGLTHGDNFVLPGARWMPTPQLSLSAWPNVDGEYRLDADYRPTATERVRYTYEHDQHLLSLSSYRASGVEYYLEARDRDGVDARFESGIRWSSEYDHRGRLELAAISTESGELGYHGRAEKTFFPGVYASLEVRDEPALQTDLWDGYDPGLTIQFRFTLDYSLANGRLVPASMTLNNTNSGSIAGHVVVHGGSEIPAQLEEVTLLIDGRPRSVLSRDGRFHIGGLKPGLYNVRLDHDSLPIELVPAGESLWVKVAHAAVTRVDFLTELQFGIAGRLMTANGQFVAHSKLRIIDVEGNAWGSVYTDQFGLYRADGLSPGRYRIESVARIETEGDDAESVRATTVFTISDNFLFGVDLILSPDPRS